MGWFKDLFTTKDVVTDSGLPKVSNIQPMPTVKPCKPEKEISEPVYAIVKAMQERPSTFKSVTTKHASDLSYSYTVKDIKTGQSLTVASETRLWWADGYIIRYMYSWAWLTEDEGELLHTTFVEINKKKMERKSNIERARMKGIYK